MADAYKVQVVDSRTGEIVKTLEAATERAAERVERGLNINLDHDRFHTQIRRAAAAIGEKMP